MRIAKKIDKRIDKRTDKRVTERGDKRTTERTDKRFDRRVTERGTERGDKQITERTDKRFDRRVTERDTERGDKRITERTDKRVAEGGTKGGTKRGTKRGDKRITERTDKRFDRRVTERGTERGDKRTTERTNKRFAERTDKRVTERGTERGDKRTTERTDKRFAERTDKRFSERGTERGAKRIDRRITKGIDKGITTGIDKGITEGITEGIIEGVAKRSVKKVAKRIAKHIADSGVSSRREAEAMIFNGRVAVDGKTLTSPAYNVEEGTRITLDGSPLPQAQPLQLYLFHKPREVLTARSDGSRTCLPNLLPPSLANLKPVGRLDFLSEGLLLLTTSGELARHLELPQNAWQRHYRLRLHGSQDKEALARLEKLKEGITIEGVYYRPVSVFLKKPRRVAKNVANRVANRVFKTRTFNAVAKSNFAKSNFWIEATLSEGKNRELRKIMQALGYGISRLLRTHYGPFGLERLARGAYRRVSDEELRTAIGENLWDALQHDNKANSFCDARSPAQGKASRLSSSSATRTTLGVSRTETT